MSEEEKKAIEELINDCDNCPYNQCEQCEINWTQVQAIKKLKEELKDSINARFELQRRIDKLQKENETLKEEIKDLIKENHKHIDYIADMKKKHEDKIRDKIEELEKEYNNCKRGDTFKKAKLLYQIAILEELLGDDE